MMNIWLRNLGQLALIIIGFNVLEIFEWFPKVGERSFITTLIIAIILSILAGIAIRWAFPLNNNKRERQK